MDTTKALDAIINPSSVCIIGATEGTRMSGRSLTHLLAHGYGGEIYLVNPRRQEVAGRVCYPSVAALPEVPDTAIIVSPAATVLPVLRECAERGIRTATVVAAGLTEGAAGADAEQFRTALRATLDETGMRILGPNTPGLVNLRAKYAPRAASLGPADTMVAGNLGIVSQSGALGLTALNKAVLHGVGVHAVVHTGNQFDIDVWDVAEYFLQDDRVEIIAMVIEGFKDPDRFLAVAAAAREARKPILLLKVGTSRAGAAVVTTHSGALAGEAAVHRSVLAQANVVQVDDIDQLWEVAQLFQRWGVPRAPIRRLAVAALSGGEAAIAADIAEASGFELPPLSSATVAKLEPLFSFAEFGNPFDITAQFTSDPSLIDSTLSALAADSNFDALLVTLSNMPPNAATDLIATWIADHAEDARPVGVASRVVSSYALPTRLEWAAGQVPVLEGCERFVGALRLYSDYAGSLADRLDRHVRRRSQSCQHHGGDGALAAAPRILGYWESRQILGELDLPFNNAAIVATAADAEAAASRMTMPVTVKASSVDIVHKAAVGAVHDLVPSAAEVGTIAAGMLARWWPSGPPAVAAGEGVIVEGFVQSRLAVFVGCRRDPEFGPMVLFGLGGSYAEAYGDVLSVPWPSAADELPVLVERSRIGGLLGRLASSAVGELVRHLSTVGEWFAEHPDVESVDLNPLLVNGSGEGCFVDARVALF
ncbi:acetate--CoA ligase family protein [Sporichthya sp.]|uniref:acetate--CoA ligase family protein n=1 Tax=Sporichthya sp. TaxID=65475 RepID=UPI001820C238|nr:acetate--CoA ligase family protein [Sporichthya sp.]MBA3741442.1 acetate--CoA ligase family protein [Sporichthya sp.]